MLKIIGLHVNENGTGTTWLTDLTTTWKNIVHFIRRTTSKSWDGDDSTVRLLARSLLKSTAVYVYNYTNHTRIQKNKIEVLNRGAIRAVTGLPKFTRTQHLYTQVGLNTIADLAIAQQVAQEHRLRGAPAGRHLTELGFDISHLSPLTPSTPPYEIPHITHTKSIPRNMGTTASKRRRAISARYAELVQGASPNGPVWFLYTYAAMNGTHLSTACYFLNSSDIIATLSQTHCSIREPELRGVLPALTKGATAI